MTTKQTETKPKENKSIEREPNQAVPNGLMINITATFPGKLVLIKLAELLDDGTVLTEFRKQGNDCIVEGQKPPPQYKASH
jgi:hypothetical protein